LGSDPRIGSLGETKLIDWEVDASIYVSLALLKPDNIIHQRYLYAYSKSPIFVEAVEKRSLLNAAPKKINMAEIGGVPVAFPQNKAEQIAIADALSDADKHIRGLEQLIEKKRLIKQGAMQELLSGHKRLPGFSGEWAVQTFGEVFAFLPTATNSRADLEPGGDAYYVHYGDIHTRFHTHLNFSLVKPPTISRARCPRAAPIKNGDWIMVDASEDFDGVGKAVEVRGLAEHDVAMSGLHTFLLREKTPVFVPGFKGHLGSAEFLRKQYLRVMTGMKVYGVSKTALRDLLITGTSTRPYVIAARPIPTGRPRHTHASTKSRKPNGAVCSSAKRRCSKTFMTAFRKTNSTTETGWKLFTSWRGFTPSAA